MDSTSPLPSAPPLERAAISIPARLKPCRNRVSIRRPCSGRCLPKKLTFPRERRRRRRIARSVEIGGDVKSGTQLPRILLRPIKEHATIDRIVTKIHANSSPKASHAQTWRFLVGILCVALILVGSTLQVAHTHRDGLEHPDCSLCATAHVAVQVTTHPIPLPASPVARRATILPQLLPSTSLSTYALFTRPPPSTSLTR